MMLVNKPLSFVVFLCFVICISVADGKVSTKASSKQLTCHQCTWLLAQQPAQMKQSKDENKDSEKNQDGNPKSEPILHAEELKMNNRQNDLFHRCTNCTTEPGGQCVRWTFRRSKTDILNVTWFCISRTNKPRGGLFVQYIPTDASHMEKEVLICNTDFCNSSTKIPIMYMLYSFCILVALLLQNRQ